MAATRNELASIHIGLKKTGMDDGQYRAMLQDRYGVDSSKSLGPDQVGDLISFLRSLSDPPPVGRATPAGGVWHGRPRPSADKKGQINKIIRLCDLLGRLGQGLGFLAYADGIAQKMFFRNQKDVKIFVEHLTSEQLRKVIHALNLQCERENVPGWRP